MRRIFDLLYRRIRGTEAGIDPTLSSVDLGAAIGRRSLQFIRAKLGSGGASFIDRGVVIRCRRKLYVDSGVSIGRNAEIDALSIHGIELSEKVTIDSNAILRASGVIRSQGIGIRVGARTSIGAFNMIQGQGGIEIGRDCLLGPYVAIFSENHRYEDRGTPIRQQGEDRQKTTIGNDVWLGAGSTVLAGSTIGDGCIVAAGAVVRGVIPSYSVVGGVPATILKSR